MRSRFGTHAFCGIALLLAACASKLPVGTSFDPLEAFPAEATWRWDAASNVLPADERIVAMDLDPVLHDAIATELTSRGYRDAGGGRPDYLVSYELGLTTRIRPETSISVASLSLLMRDFETRRRVWLTFIQTEVDTKRSADERGARIHEVVARMLEHFPPGRDD